MGNFPCSKRDKDLKADLEPSKISTEPEKSIPLTQKIQIKWDAVSELYDEVLSGGTLNLSQNFTQLMKIPLCKNILEMGCGNGDYSCDVVTLKSPAASLVTFDLAPKFVNMANARLTHLDVNYKNFLQAINDVKTRKCENILSMDKPVKQFKNINTTLAVGDAENLSTKLAPNNKFDAVFGNCVLQIVSDPQQMLQRVYKCMAKGGRAAFTVWGAKEGSDFFTVVPSCFMNVDKFKEMMSSANSRTLWHLNDTKKVLDYMESIGFKHCRSMELFTYYTFCGEKGEELIKKHTEYSTYDIRIKLENDEDRAKLDECCAEAVEKLKKILIDERRPVGFKSILYWGDK